MPTDKKMGARDGRVTKEKTSRSALEAFGAKALGLFSFGGNTAGIRTANEPLKGVAGFVKRRKKSQQERQRNR